MSAAEKGEIEYSGLELAIIQSLREGERATLSVLMISGSDGVSGDTRVDVHLKDGVLQCKLDSETNTIMQCTDPATGGVLPPEPNVVYM